MDRIKTLVVDDEALARKRISLLLAEEQDFEILEECASGAKAIQAIESMEPDLVFLDIQMPGINGFDVLRNVEPEQLPLVVFVTAYDQYAVQAFEVHALDYLLKPFEDERFTQTLSRIRERLAGQGNKESRLALMTLLEEVKARRKEIDRLLIKSAGRVFFMPLGKIDWIEASGNYVRIHAAGEVHFMRETMGDMENQLPPARFVRVHRSAIVNLKKIKELLPSTKGEFDIELLNGEKITLSRKYRAVFEDRLGKPI
jgi:two-component system LytT family response regulator